MPFDNNYNWITPDNGKKYDAIFKAAESRYDLPDGLLSLMAFIETGGKYDPNTLNRVTGAAGLFQMMPRTYKITLRVNPYDVTAATFAAAKYLAYLWDKTGSWEKAIAAYNWGIGNVTRKGLAAMPRETSNYLGKIAPLGILYLTADDYKAYYAS